MHEIIGEPPSHTHLLAKLKGLTMQATIERLKSISIRGEREPSKTQGEIEAAICEGMSRFEQVYMGRGPKRICAHLLGDLLIVRMQGVLTVAEQHLVITVSVEKGRDLLKQVRARLIEVARPALESLVQGVTGVKLVSLHSDISTVTGEQIVVFTLDGVPRFHDTKLN